MEKSRVTIKDIAGMLNVSTATVTKALNGQPRVSEEMRRQVLATAEKIGYKPNRSAQALVRGEIRITAVYMEDPPEYFKYVERGYTDALEELADYKLILSRRNVSGIYDTARMKTILEDVLKEKPDGLLMAPIMRQHEYAGVLEEIIATGIPVLFIIQEMEGIKGIGTLQPDWRVIGKMAAQIFNLCMPQDSKIAVITTKSDFKAHMKCIDGFNGTIDVGKIKTTVFENQDNRQITYYITEEIIKNHPDINGIYITSYNAVQVCKCIEDNGAYGRFTVVGQDLYPELYDCIDKGLLLATISPNQYQIGYQGIRMMFNRICGDGVSAENAITPLFIMKSNLECYKEVL